MLGNVESILLNGAKFILDKVYDSIGFNRVDDNVLRHLVVARLCHPMSRMATVDYLNSGLRCQAYIRETIHLRAAMTISSP